MAQGRLHNSEESYPCSNRGLGFFGFLHFYEPDHLTDEDDENGKNDRGWENDADDNNGVAGSAL